MPITETRRGQGQVGTKKVRVVCRTCNGGWLSGLEADCQGVLDDLIAGYSRTLTVDDTRLLAKWVAKTTMTAEYIQRDQVAISQETRDRFYIDRTPPAHWSIWIAFYCGTAWRWGNIFHHGIGMYMPPLPVQPGVKNTQYTVIALGRFMCVCAGSEDERQFFRLDASTAPAIKRIWPLESTDQPWPPERSVDDVGAQRVAAAFGTMLGMPVSPLRSARAA